MKHLTATLCLTIAVLLGSGGMSWSADWNRGTTAFMRGDFATALRELTPLAKQGDAGAQSNLANLAEQGNAFAQYNLGEMHKTGQGVPQNYQTAAKWYRLAAEQGYASAQFKLGVMYGNGEGVIQDNVYSYMWFNIAATNGDAHAVKGRDIVAKWMNESYAETQDIRDTMKDTG